MKTSHFTHITLSIILSIGTILAGCADENIPGRQPIAKATIDKSALSINESMNISFEGVADQVVIYTGDEGHRYDSRDQNHTGFVVNKGHFSYAYSVPGKFKVVVLATTYDSYLGENLRTDTTIFQVTVTDNVTTIDRLYSSITPNIYYAELIGETDWVLRLPSKQVYNGREVNLNAARQRLAFDIASDSTQIDIDGKPWVAREYYDLTQDHRIDVKASSGDRRTYFLRPMIYPEPKSLTLDGMQARIVRDPYRQDVLTMTASLSGTSQADAVRLQFTLEPEATLYIDDKPVSDGDIVDLTHPGNCYIIKTHPQNPAVKAITTLLWDVK